MEPIYLKLSEWMCGPHKNYFHLFIHCIARIFSYIKQNGLNKDSVIFYIDYPILESKPAPFFFPILQNFINIHKETKHDTIKPVIIDVRKYHDISYLVEYVRPLCKYNKPLTNIVFIKRKVRRSILNEQECVEILKQNISNTQYSVIDVYFEDMSFDEQIQLMAGCKLLIGAHGAGFTNTLFMNSSSAVLELFPESFYTGCYKELCNIKAISHFVLHGKDATTPPISLEVYKKEAVSNAAYNNYQFRQIIRDVSYTIDTELLVKKVHEILS